MYSILFYEADKVLIGLFLGDKLPKILKQPTTHMFKLFSKYLTVGVFNTAIHWLVFSVGVYMFSVNQAAANFIAFTSAVTFSFFANAAFTFKTKPKVRGYFLFVTFMGMMSILVGKLSDYYQISPIITLVEFSMISLICGFFYSKHIVFREEK